MYAPQVPVQVLRTKQVPVCHLKVSVVVSIRNNGSYDHSDKTRTDLDLLIIIMETKFLLLVALTSLSVFDAFMISHPFISSFARGYQTALPAVIEIGSEAAFDKKIKSSGSALVIVDYSTTWCGPCKGTFSHHYQTN
jgi:thiol-disulfide isomerase/thioredoxin